MEAQPQSGKYEALGYIFPGLRLRLHPGYFSTKPYATYFPDCGCASIQATLVQSPMPHISRIAAAPPSRLLEYKALCHILPGLRLRLHPGYLSTKPYATYFPDCGCASIQAAFRARLFNSEAKRHPAINVRF
jgi:hypothetical protein